MTAQVYKIEKVFFTSGINNVYFFYTHMKKIEIFVKWLLAFDFIVIFLWLIVLKFSYLLFLISWIQFHYIFVEKASICRPALYARSTLRERICVRVHQKGCLNLQPCHDIFFNTSCFVLLGIFSFCCSYHFARDGQNILFEN